MPQQTAAAAAAGDQASQLARLPAALLARILQALPQWERLSSCATVSSSWAAAAAAATVKVDVPHRGTSFFQPWLNRHAGQLVSLSAMCYTYGEDCSQLRLPCAELVSLTQLQLEKKALVFDSLGSNSTAEGAGRMPPLPKLRQLELEECNLLSVEALLQFSVLTSLTSLQLEEICINSSQQVQAKQGPDLSNALCTVLAQLPQLKNVKLRCEQLAGSSLSSVVQQPSSLRQLRNAYIGIPQTAAQTDDLLSALPRGLTGLTVRYDRRDRPSPSSPSPYPATFPQQMPHLSDLQQLALYKAVFDPGMLSVMTRLQQLYMCECTLRPMETDENAAVAKAAACAAASAFLTAVGGMTDLVSLTARGIKFGSGHLLFGGAPAAAFSDLTASSKLQELVLETEDTLPLPWGAVQHAFPAGRVLPHLTHLSLPATSDFGHPVDNWDGRPGFISAQHGRMTSKRTQSPCGRMTSKRTQSPCPTVGLKERPGLLCGSCCVTGWRRARSSMGQAAEGQGAMAAAAGADKGRGAAGDCGSAAGSG